MRRSRLLARFALGAAALTLVGTTTLKLAAQQPGQQPPVIPETNVVAEPPTQPAAAQAPATNSVLDNSVFASPPVDGYLAEDSTTGTIFNIPDRSFPGTVNVVPRDVIRDQQILRFTDVLRDVPGAIAAGDNLRPDAFFVRGYLIESRDYRKNGMLDPTYTPRDFANVERVEILKGPASVLYGVASNSGMVNVITKKPVADSFSLLTSTFGTWDQQRYTIDTNGMSQSGSLLYRVNAAYEHSNSFRDFEHLERTFVSPAVTWVVDSDSTLTFEGEFHEDRRLGDRGIPAYGPNAPLGYPVGTYAFPPSRSVNEPANDNVYYEDYRAALFLNHRINDQWALNVSGSSLYFEFPSSSTFGSFGVGGTNIIRGRSNSVDREQSHSVIANLFGEGDVAGIPNKVLIGTEQVYYDSDSTYATQAAFVPFDVANPVYNNPTFNTLFSTRFPVFKQVRHGYYFQDYAEVTDNISVLSGVRIDDVTQFAQQNALVVKERYVQATPRVGVVWQPLPVDVAFYWNYSQSFSPPGGATIGALLPQEGEQWEGGVKTLLSDNLTLNLAGYHNTLTNKAFRTVGNVLSQTADARAQGVEVSLTGQFTDRLNTIANYAYTDTYLSNGDAVFTGQRERNVPLNTVNFWTRYDLVQTQNQTVGLALGMVCVDNRLGNIPGTLILPGYTRWDMGVYHRFGRWFSQMYIENVFDKYYIQSSQDVFAVNFASPPATSVFPGAPVNGRIQIGVNF